MSDTDVLRELAHIELDAEDLIGDQDEALMDDTEFERQANLAGEGRWEELDLDPMPDGWTPVTIDDLRNAS